MHWVMDLLNRCNNIFNDISFICMVQRNESKLKYFSSQFSNTSVLTSSRSYNVFSLIPFMYSSHSACPDLCTTLNLYCSKARGMEMYLIKRLFFQFCMLKKILSFENGKHISLFLWTDCVWVRFTIYSPISIIQYTCMGLCVFSLPISLVMIERIYTLSYCHHQIGSMNYIYYPLFRVRSSNNGMCCLSLYSYCDNWCDSSDVIPFIHFHVFFTNQSRG